MTLVVLIGGATVAWNARRIAEAFHEGAAFIGELMAVQDKLVTAYRTPDVNVQWVIDPQSSVREGGSVPGRRLVVRMVNSPFLKETKLEEAEGVAREIASLAVATLKDPSTTSTVDVMLAKQAGFGIVESRKFSFAAAELAGGR